MKWEGKQMEETQNMLNAFIGKTIKSIDVDSIYCRENEVVTITFEDGTLLGISASSDDGESTLHIWDETEPG